MTSGETLNEGDWVYQDTGDSKVKKLLATSSSDTQRLIGVVVTPGTTAADSDVSILESGIWNSTNVISGSLGERYLSTTTAGAMVSIPPVLGEQVWLGVKIAPSKMIVRIGSPSIVAGSDYFKNFLKDTKSLSGTFSGIFPYIDSVDSVTSITIKTDVGFCTIQHISGERRLYKVAAFSSSIDVTANNLYVKVIPTNTVLNDYYLASIQINSTAPSIPTSYELCRIQKVNDSITTSFDHRYSDLYDKSIEDTTAIKSFDSVSKILKGSYPGSLGTKVDTITLDTSMRSPWTGQLSSGTETIDELVISGNWNLFSFTDVVNYIGYIKTGQQGNGTFTNLVLTDHGQAVKLIPHSRNYSLLLSKDVADAKHYIYSISTSGTIAPVVVAQFDLSTFTMPYHTSADLVDIISDGIYIYVSVYDSVAGQVVLKRFIYDPEKDDQYFVEAAIVIEDPKAPTSAVNTVRLTQLKDYVALVFTDVRDVYMRTYERPKPGFGSVLVENDNSFISGFSTDTTAAALGVSNSGSGTTLIKSISPTTEGYYNKDPNDNILLNILQYPFAEYRSTVSDSLIATLRTIFAPAFGVNEFVVNATPYGGADGYLYSYGDYASANTSAIFTSYVSGNLYVQGGITSPPKGIKLQLIGNWFYCVFRKDPNNNTQVVAIKDIAYENKVAKSVSYRGWQISGQANLYLPKGFYYEDTFYDNTTVYCPGVQTIDTYGMHYLGYSDGKTFFVGQTIGTNI
jgi:hypothetical protein